MQTAIKWLLDRLESEGRHDLISAYHEHNRAYQQYRADIQRQQRQQPPQEATIQIVDMEDWYEFVGAKSLEEVHADMEADR